MLPFVALLPALAADSLRVVLLRPHAFTAVQHGSRNAGNGLNYKTCPQTAACFSLRFSHSSTSDSACVDYYFARRVNSAPPFRHMGPRAAAESLARGGGEVSGGARGRRRAWPAAGPMWSSQRRPRQIFFSATGKARKPPPPLAPAPLSTVKIYRAEHPWSCHHPAAANPPPCFHLGHHTNSTNEHRCEAEGTIHTDGVQAMLHMKFITVVEMLFACWDFFMLQIFSILQNFGFTCATDSNSNCNIKISFLFSCCNVLLKNSL
ncbi:unnamed protein product [Urochloa humidicola]